MPETQDLRKSRVAFQASTTLTFQDAVERCREALAEEGFGVLAELDIKATLKKKLGVDCEPYLILGACHAPSAHRALQARPDVGVLLPCNVTVSVEDGATVIRALNPRSVLGLLDSPELGEVGEEVAAALRRALEKAAA